MLEHATYRGFSRILMGDPGTAFRRLVESEKQDIEVEIGFINLTNRDEEARAMIDDMLLRLVPGGAGASGRRDSPGGHRDRPFRRHARLVAVRYRDCLTFPLCVLTLITSLKVDDLNGIGAPRVSFVSIVLMPWTMSGFSNEVILSKHDVSES